MIVPEAAVIIGIVGWVAAPVFTRLIDKARSYTVNKYKWHKGLPEKLESLAHFLDEIFSTVSLVEARRFNNRSMVCWLLQLKDAIDEVDDIFDDLDYQILKATQMENPADTSGQASRAAGPAMEAGLGSIGSAESSDRLKRLLKKLKDIRQSSRGLVQASILAVAAAGWSDSSTSRPVTGPLPLLESLGYDDQYNKLLKWLVPDEKKLNDSSYNDRSVVAIIGHGGMGKTTLCQRAWNDPCVNERFGLVIWASVYNRFSEADLLAEIWRSVAATERHGHGEMSISSIQQALVKLVVSKRYLLVLDDVCNDETATELRRRETWGHVLAPFSRHGERGSRVLLTTRAMICAQTIGADESRTMVVSGIDRDSFISLLKSTAASGVSGEAPHARDLEVVLRSSALLSDNASESVPPSTWRHSPLSAKEIGLKLRNTQNKNNWAAILATDCHENAISVHVSCYQQLPPHLQYCLAFLGLFPNGFEFQSEMLVKMWVAHGFVSDEGGRTMEDTAGEYFNDLLLRSFLQEVKAEEATTRYSIHKQIHSMIRSVSGNYFLMIQGNRAAAKIPLTVRHLSVTTGCLAQLRKHSVLKRLRTLLIFRDPSSPAAAIDQDLLKEIKQVRVLDLTGTDIKDLNQEIGNLIHLRYLALPDTLRLQMFPSAVTKLFHLQTLIWTNNDAQKAVVHNHMKIDLTFKFRVDNNKTNLLLLARMDSLRGSLSITGLDAVASKQDAQKAQLRRKNSVKVLKLEWGATDGLIPSGSDVLEDLEPPTGIQVLQIRRYRGASAPTWLANDSLQQLTRLYIINCRKWENLPPFGRLPCLNHLHIQEMKLVKRIDGSGPFKSLETLVLSDMPNLAEWIAGPAHSGFHMLKRIEIMHCPVLAKPPPLPPSLELIKVRDCSPLQPILNREGVYQAELDLDF